MPTLAELKQVLMAPHAAARGARTRCPRWRSWSTCTRRRTLPLEGLEHGAHAGGAEALAHGAARCRKRGSNTVPTLAKLKQKSAHAGGAEALALAAARCR